MKIVQSDVNEGIDRKACMLLEQGACVERVPG
jgi:hypothetical protein